MDSHQENFEKVIEMEGEDDGGWVDTHHYAGMMSLGLLWFYYSISGLVSVGFSQKTAVLVFSQFWFLHKIWVKQTINCKRNNVIRELHQLRPM